jgi:hypothetical protein
MPASLSLSRRPRTPATLPFGRKNINGVKSFPFFQFIPLNKGAPKAGDFFFGAPQSPIFWTLN